MVLRYRSATEARRRDVKRYSLFGFSWVDESSCFLLRANPALGKDGKRIVSNTDLLRSNSWRHRHRQWHLGILWQLGRRWVFFVRRNAVKVFAPHARPCHGHSLFHMYSCGCLSVCACVRATGEKGTHTNLFCHNPHAWCRLLN